MQVILDGVYATEMVPESFDSKALELETCHKTPHRRAQRWSKLNRSRQSIFCMWDIFVRRGEGAGFGSRADSGPIILLDKPLSH